MIRRPQRVLGWGTALLVALLASSGGRAQAQLAHTPWPMFQHDLRHTGRSELVGPRAAHVRWIYDRPDRFACKWTCPTFRGAPTLGADGTVYVGLGFEPLCALDPANGSERWCTGASSGEVARSSPSVAASGAIAIGARDNKLWDIAPNGAVAWTYRIFTDGDVLTSPAILPSGDIAIACNFGAALHTLHPDGSLAWTLRLGGGSRNISPAIAADGTIFMGTTNGSLYAVSPSGALLWKLRAGRTNNNSSPAIAADGTIYIGSKSGVAAVDPITHAVRWTFPVRRGVDATPAIAADGTIYFGSNLGTFYALRPDGQLEWSAPGRGGFLASAAIGADGVVYTASGRSVVAYSPGDATHAAGAVLWEYETGGLIESSLAIGPGATLYAASRDDKLYAFGP